MAIGSIVNTSTLTLTFDGEFNNGFVSSPNGSTGLWQTTLVNGGRTLGGNGEQEYYSDSSVGYNPFSVQNGVLSITAQPASVAGSNALSLPYDSGVITTEGSFNQLYGYFEIDAKMPAGQGLWPAFWMVPASGAWPPELDAFEVLGNNPTTLYFSTHSAVQATQGTTLTVPDVSSGFNLYGVMWGPQTVELFINNVEVASMPTPPDMNVPMYMLANLAVGGYWPGDPNSTTPFPATMQIAYVKAFAYPGTTGGTVYDTLPSQNVGAAPVAPTITAPGSVQAEIGVTSSLGNVSVAANWPGGNFTVMVSDYSGLLETSPTADVFTSGEDTTGLSLTGNLAAINAALATLTYHGTTTGADWVWIGATDPQGQQGTASEVANVGTTAVATAVSAAPMVTTPSSGLTVAAGGTVTVAGVSVSDGQAVGNVTVVISDSSGLLSTTAMTGLTQQGEGTTALTLNGSLATINADLVGLTYQASATAGPDTVSIALTDISGRQAIGRVAIDANATGVADTPVVTTPASESVVAGGTLALGAISVADPLASGNLSVVVSDSTGLLSVAAASGVTEAGAGTTSLTLTGSLAAINADLATLTYRAGTVAGTDGLSTTATTADGAEAGGATAITVTTPTATATPVVTMPSTETLAAGATLALSGISVADSQPAGTFSISVSDSTGLLQTSATSGVMATGEGTAALTLTGNLVAVDASLSSLIYHAGQASGSDWLWVSANGPTGPQALGSAVVTVTQQATVGTAPAGSVTPVVTTPATASVVAGTTQTLSGVSVADSLATGTFTIAVSDSTGLLHANAASGVTEVGEGTTALTLSGSLTAINADLASLTYQASQASGTDWLWVSANGPGGLQGVSPIVVTVAPPSVMATPVVTVPTSLSLTAGASQALTGISVADSQGSGTFTVTLSDSKGLLGTSPISGVTAQGEDTTALTLTGSLAAINTDLTYQAGTTAGADSISVSASVASGGAGSGVGKGSVAVTVTAPVLPVVTTQAVVTMDAGTTRAVTGVSVADSQPGGIFTIRVSDSTGLLQTAAASGVTELGEGTTALTLTGSLAAINADLTSLTYHAAATAGTDWLWVSANSPSGSQGISPVVVTVAPLPLVTAPATASVVAGATLALSGVSVADSQSGGAFTVTVSDSSGRLQTATASGVTQLGEGTTALTLTGSLAAINADLAGLTYHAGTAAGTDWLWVSASDADGGQGTSSVAVTVAPAPSAHVLMAAVATQAVTNVQDDTTVSLSGISIGTADTPRFLVATLTDQVGLLATTGGHGVIETGEGTTTLVLRGLLANVNAELSSLTYTSDVASLAPVSAAILASGPTDTLTLAVAPGMSGHLGATGSPVSTMVFPLYDGHIVT
jgi:beta-glucanase (GH16 family)